MGAFVCTRKRYTLIITASRLAKLQDLKLSHMWALSDHGLKMFLLGRSMHSVAIQALHLEACVELTDAGIEDALSLCPDLKLLDLSSNRMITGSFLQNAQSKCPALQSLSIRNCPLQISKSELDNLYSKRYKLFHY